MFDFEIGGNEIKPESAEGIVNIPFNRTLLAQKLTHQTPVNPETVYGLKTVEAVFDHFKPEVEVEMETIEGMPKKETLKFRSVADFRVKEMVAQSPFLRSLDAQFQEYTQISRRLQGHRILQTALGNPDTKAALIETLQALVAELEAGEKTEA
ncbi:hypothetical protein [Spirosoma foliorum]|uniref:Type VI secretion system contractile sheath small subunit n=1 Tax=Spirosoma foliorum TaxID=2710596 RepID=A0A7G5GVX0_9BACT|nr:hypothetical protein [Spirosoma foliorum]QMW03012.1 hypothetical protein H3H32_34880 [Spirosoma foliorum]